MPEVLLVNPRRRTTRRRKSSPRKRRTTAKRRTYRRNPVSANPRRRTTRRRRSYKRNPAKLNLQSFLKQTLMPSAMGAVGALGVDVVLGFLPLPANFKTGMLRPVVKGVGAVAIGLVANMVANRKVAEQITAGGLTVVLYDTMKTFVTQQFPALPMGEYVPMAYYSPGPTIGSDMGAYVEQMGNIDTPFNGFDESLGAYVEEGFQY